MSDIVERLRDLRDNFLDLDRAIQNALAPPEERRIRSDDLVKTIFASIDEIERLRERIEELRPYEVVSGEQWKARVAQEQIEEQAAQLKQNDITISGLNARIKNLQAKIKGYETPAPSAETKSSPELEGVSG